MQVVDGYEFVVGENDKDFFATITLLIGRVGGL
jgi:hypothetical protein